jgi:hypothetical protein
VRFVGKCKGYIGWKVRTWLRCVIIIIRYIILAGIALVRMEYLVALRCVLCKIHIDVLEVSAIFNSLLAV